MLCVEESQVFSSTIEVLLLAPAFSQARPTSAKREGSSLVPRPLIRKNGLATYPGSNCIRM